MIVLVVFTEKAIVSNPDRRQNKKTEHYQLSRCFASRINSFECVAKRTGTFCVLPAGISCR
jgi:hypothetical protein